MAGEPFKPLGNTGLGIDVAAALRIAHAAEYAADQLGLIARTAAEIESHLAKIAKHYPEPGSADDVLNRKLGSGKS
jgi:hypothetical protein